MTSAVEREMRRLLAARDAEILARVGTTDDLDPLVWWTPVHGAIDHAAVVDEAVADADRPALDG